MKRIDYGTIAFGAAVVLVSVLFAAATALYLSAPEDTVELRENVPCVPPPPATTAPPSTVMS